jgi:hypothetical protein
MDAEYIDRMGYLPTKSWGIYQQKAGLGKNRPSNAITTDLVP